MSTSFSTLASSNNCVLKLALLNDRPHRGQEALPFTNSKSTQFSHNEWPQTLTSNLSAGFRYLFVLHRRQLSSLSMARHPEKQLIAKSSKRVPSRPINSQINKLPSFTRRHHERSQVAARRHQRASHCSPLKTHSNS